ncbi:MAG: DUF4389 domain-containing protein [Candidatus Aegiribacteria sp.]|nr:DUF4389 domain-containing protein [Candidatus Aegiribacteria sp.]
MEQQTNARRNLKADLIRGAFMLLFFVAARCVGVLVSVITLFQFLCALIAGKPNGNVKHFGRNLSLYAAEIIQFLSYSTDRKPWPYSKWPEEIPLNPEPAVE